MVSGSFNDSANLPEQKRISVRDTPASDAGPLICSSQSEIFASLRGVGRYFHELKLRRHLEWVWDGSRLWIVQNDADTEAEGESPLPKNCSHTAPIDSKKLKVFEAFDASRGNPWQKLECVRDFHAAGMPTTPLYFITGVLVQKNLKSGAPSRSLTNDLKLLLGQPLVIRTDVRDKTAFLLARTDTVHDATSAVDFMKRVVDETIKQSRPLKDVCFIIHRFIPAAASAFSFAIPGNRRVRVDAIWGLPDGLEFCAHDSFELDGKIPKLLDKRIRFKPTFLANLPNGQWKAAQLATPYNWSGSISEKDLKRIAATSFKLAEQKGKAVVIMWLARIPSESGHPDLLPWRLTMEGAPRDVAASSSSHFFGSPFQVRNGADLEKLQEQADKASSVVLRPDGPHLRNETFLLQLAEVATKLKLPIDLDGSFLSHAYYVLCRAGAQVACIDPIDPPPVKTSFRKLVRDRIPVKIERSGESAETTTLLRPDLLELLRTKMVEEALEVLGAGDHILLREEMADVYEVLRAMCHVLDIEMADIKHTADEKKKTLGGFQDGVLLVETKDMPLIAVDEAPTLFTSPTSAKKINIQPFIGVAGRKAKSQIDRILLPLVPPVPGRYRGAMRVEIRQLNAQFKIVYNEKSVEVILEGSVRPTLRGQLDLFSKDRAG